MSESTVLNNERINKIDEFIGFLLDQHAAGKISRNDAILDIGHLMSAVDKRNLTEVEGFPDIKRNQYLAK